MQLPNSTLSATTTPLPAALHSPSRSSCSPPLRRCLGCRLPAVATAVPSCSWSTCASSASGPAGWAAHAEPAACPSSDCISLSGMIKSTLRRFLILPLLPCMPASASPSAWLACVVPLDCLLAALPGCATAAACLVGPLVDCPVGEDIVRAEGKGGELGGSVEGLVGEGEGKAGSCPSLKPMMAQALSLTGTLRRLASLCTCKQSSSCLMWIPHDSVCPVANSHPYVSCGLHMTLCVPLQIHNGAMMDLQQIQKPLMHAVSMRVPLAAKHLLKNNQ